MAGNYVCFYCGIKVDQYEELYQHTKSHGPCDSTQELFKEQTDNQLDVKLDVTNLLCELCKSSFYDLDSTVDHLNAKHKFHIDKDTNISVTAYNLKDLKCAICDGKFECIEDLISHVYVKHSQRAVTDTCLKYRKVNGCQRKINNFSEAVTSRVARKRHSKTSVRNKEESHSAEGRTRTNRCFDRTDKGLSRRQMIKLNRENLAYILKMSTAIPFKYYQNRFTCFYCSKSFLEHEEMRQHTTTMHTLEEIESNLPKVLKKINSRATIDIAALSCRLCRENFDALDNLVDHLVEKHGAKCDRDVSGTIQAFKLVKYGMLCPSCPEKYSYFNSLLKHINEVHATKSHLCSACGARFGNEAVLSSHISRTHGKDTFKCEDCSCSFKAMIKLRSHRARVHGTKEFPCTLCGEKFPTDYGKHKHLLAKHKIGHKCTECDRMFIKDSFMRNHVRRIHLAEREIECTVCKRKFFDKEQLKFHMVKHVGSRDFHCDVCGKGFFWKKNLSVHMNSHNKRLK